MLTTDGHLLNGRVVYRQPAAGFRSGIEPVLLAASVPAKPGDHVLEAGSGAGAALLCLMMRVPGVQATGVEMQPGLAELAAANAASNGFSAMRIIPERIELAALPAVFDHAMANPPYHRPEGSISPDVGKETAKRASTMLIGRWIERLGGALRHRGTLTLSVPAGLVPACLQIMAEARCPCTAVLPLWPKAGRAAKLVLLRGIKGARGPMQILPGLVLHRADGSYSEAAETVLRTGSALPFEL